MNAAAGAADLSEQPTVSSSAPPATTIQRPSKGDGSAVDGVGGCNIHGRRRQATPVAAPQPAGSHGPAPTPAEKPPRRPQPRRHLRHSDISTVFTMGTQKTVRRAKELRNLSQQQVTRRTGSLRFRSQLYMKKIRSEKQNIRSGNRNDSQISGALHTRFKNPPSLSIIQQIQIAAAELEFNAEASISKICGGEHFKQKVGLRSLVPAGYKIPIDSREVWKDFNADRKLKQRNHSFGGTINGAFYACAEDRETTRSNSVLCKAFGLSHDILCNWVGVDRSPAATKPHLREYGSQTALPAPYAV